MTKTIEEAALEYAEKSKERLSSHATEPCEVAQEVEMAFVKGAVYALSLPLLSRINPAEKLRIRKEYAETYPNDPDQSIASIRVMQTLERIFGKDFFKEGE